MKRSTVWGGERNFGNEDKRAAVGVEDLTDELKIDLGFAAASDAVEEERQRGLVAFVVDGGGDDVEGFPLTGVERDRCRGEELLAAMRIAIHSFVRDTHPALLFESAANPGFEVGERQGSGGGGEAFEGLSLPGSFLGEAEAFLVRRRFGESDEFASLEGERFGADRFGKDAAKDCLKGGAVVARDPPCEFEEAGGEDGVETDDRFNRADFVLVDVALGEFENGAGCFASAQRNADARTHRDRVLQMCRDGVAELEMAGAIDENRSREGHPCSRYVDAVERPRNLI